MIIFPILTSRLAFNDTVSTRKLTIVFAGSTVLIGTLIVELSPVQSNS